MNKNILSLKNFVINTIVVSVSCFLLGYIRYGNVIFNVNSLASLFLLYGVVSAPLFYAFRDHTMKTALIVFALIILFDEFLLMYPVTLHDFFKGSLFATARALCLYLFYKKFYLTYKRSLWGPLVVGTLLAIFTLFVLIAFAAFIDNTSIISAEFWEFCLRQLSPRFLAGIGLGIGFWIADLPIMTRLLRT